MALDLLIGTNNPFKIAIVRTAVHALPFSLLTPDDLGMVLQVPEIGQTTLENAILKARAYCKQTCLPTFSIDGGLWIEKFSPEKQPGTRVKRTPAGEIEEKTLEYLSVN